MVHRVAGKRRVVGFDVEFEMLVESVLTEEGDNSRAVKIVLVLGCLFWFWFNIELSP